MRSFPIPEVLPFSEAFPNVGRAGIDGRPELLQVGPLRSLDLAIEMRRPWLDRAELDGPIHEPLLHLFGKELQAAVALDALDRKRHLLDQSVEEVQGIGGRTAGIDAENAVAWAVGEITKRARATEPPAL